MMKRGLIDWDRREIGEDVFGKRKGRILAKMAQERIAYLLVYGEIWQCDEVHYLTNFNTYTRDCVAVLASDGRLSLVSSMTPRDREWIASVSTVPGKDISFAAGLLKAADTMKKDGFSTGRVGLVGDFFPKVFYDHLGSEFPDVTFVDCTPWYRGLRIVKDSSETAMVKRASLLAVMGAKGLTGAAVFGKKEAALSAQAEWVVRSRGGEDYHFFCASGNAQALDSPSARKVAGAFAFSLLAQYKGCWSLLERTVASEELARKHEGDVRAYERLVAAVQAEGSLASLAQTIDRAKAEGWAVDIRAPLGPDARCSVIAGLDSVPREKDAVFGVSFRKDGASRFFLYGETLRAGDEGYEVLTT